ncbi:hypothetical protein, partial [Mesorhizobium sp. B2-4-15]|uniref:hypothetical protein n=1 Tax=Mesorhizobium sp. B2-4-15 TaxID=2589934 RepID=UPI001AEE106B
CFSSTFGVRLHRSIRNPRSPRGISPWYRFIPQAFPCMGWNAKPPFETDVPERKNQNAQLVKYLFHFASRRQGRFQIWTRDFDVDAGSHVPSGRPRDDAAPINRDGFFHPAGRMRRVSR